MVVVCPQNERSVRLLITPLARAAEVAALAVVAERRVVRLLLNRATAVSRAVAPSCGIHGRATRYGGVARRRRGRGGSRRLSNALRFYRWCYAAQRTKANGRAEEGVSREKARGERERGPEGGARGRGGGRGVNSPSRIATKCEQQDGEDEELSKWGIHCNMQA